MNINKNSLKERTQLLLVLAGIFLILTAILVFAVYALNSIDFIHIRISSTASVFAFLGLVMLGTGVLSVIGSMLDGFRRHVFHHSFKLGGMMIQEILLIVIFGGMIHWIDRWVDGVEIGNIQTEFTLTLFLYGLIQWAPFKDYWNLEPHRTASSYAEVVLNGCNP
ncbi:hypothetical protein [Paenibacillus lentus]|uniref:Uncharacterized protein n=1 Tax=Paenibacillus lentus TaxID=1338368 RepID=A0A3Q8S911_9BACL|nr:hypothetical protein [Paenibacillus lentus]AZK45105.1 hypothetical protein EIM92_01940 [Paenibacillus lentus]